MKKFLNALKKYFVDFGIAVAKGDIWCKLSLLVMGAGYWGRRQVVKGIMMTLLEIVVLLFTGLFSINYIKDLNTLGTVQYESKFDPLTMKNTVNNYDNSLLILLYGIVGIIVIVAFILLYISNMKAVYRLQLMKEQGEHINTFREDLKELVNGKFYVTLLTLPSIGVILMNIIPILCPVWHLPIMMKIICRQTTCLHGLDLTISRRCLPAVVQRSRSLMLL